MKLVAIICLTLLLVGCRASTEYGECIGVADDPQPELIYRWSKRNVIVGLIFSESLFVPGWVILFRLKCPVGKKT